MIRGFRAPLMVLALVAATLVSSDLASAEELGAHARPGSALFFPVYDATDRANTVIAVTNTNSNRASCGNDHRSGDVVVHFTYYVGETGAGDESCLEEDRFEMLTPGDTLTVLTSQHVANDQRGWLWVEAIDPETQDAIDFDYLIGSAIIVDLANEADFLWTYTPFVFRGTVTGGDQSACEHYFTDIANFGFADFDGNEYEKFPGRVFIDNFFAENDVQSNEAYLMIPDGLGGNEDFRLSLLIWNNDEQVTSFSTIVDCWFGGVLSSITAQFKEGPLGGADELVLDGSPVYTGWVEFSARTRVAPIRTVGMLGVYAHRMSGVADDLAAGHEMQYTEAAQNDVSIMRFP